jgi:hypothetical protein
VTRYSLTHLTNEVLRRELTTKAAKEKETTAELLAHIAHIAEFDERKLYLPAAYESMLAYCVRELGLSEDAAKKRIHVARAARNCPAMFEALAEGRVHLSGLRLLAPHITPKNAGELLAAATGKSWDDIQRLLAERSPRPEVAPCVEAVASAAPALTAGEGAARHPANTESQGVTGNFRGPARVAPLSAEAYAVQFTRGREADERFRYAQDLLGHPVKSGDIAEVYERAVTALIEKLEKIRFGAGAKPRTGGRRATSGSRHVSMDVKRAVWVRDKGHCTFVSESGRRCECRRDLQFDHVKEFARGGEATVDNIRLRCPGHNQHSAEQTFGAGFMKQKRAEAAEARANGRAARERARAEKAERAEKARLLAHQIEVLPYLRKFGCRDAESREAAALCSDMAGDSLEDRVKRALSMFGARCGRKVLPASALAEVPSPEGAPMLT